ncbi:unnamed protein product [Calypogeia fissa]
MGLKEERGVEWLQQQQLRFSQWRENLTAMKERFQGTLGPHGFPRQSGRLRAGGGLGLQMATATGLVVARVFQGNMVRNQWQKQQSAKLLLDAVPRRFSSTGAASKAGQEGKKWRFSAIILFLPCAATFGLGTWQLFRRQWKIEVLDYRRKRLEEPPIPLINAISGSVEGAKQDDKNISSSQTAIDELEFRTVICEGAYDVKKNLYVGPRARSAFGVTQKGYFVITPLLSADKSGQVPVLVNRGWVPSGWVEEPDSGQAVVPSAKATNLEKVPWWKFWTRQQNQVETLSSTQPTVTVRGVIRGSEEPNMFVPLNVPSTGQWFYVDVPAMARTLGLPENAILIEVLQEPNKSLGKETFPIAKDPEALLHSSVMPQDHINYALTWYSLSAATTFMAVRRLSGSRTGR